MVTIPPFLSCLSNSPRAQKLLGTLHQISIGIGMIIAQSLSLVLSRPAGPSILTGPIAENGPGTRDIADTYRKHMEVQHGLMSVRSGSGGMDMAERYGPAWGLWRVELLVAVLAAVLVSVVGLWMDADDDRAVEDRLSASCRSEDGQGVDDGERRPLLSHSPTSHSHSHSRPQRQSSLSRGPASTLTSTSSQPISNTERAPSPRPERQKRREAMGIREAFRGDTRYGGTFSSYPQWFDPVRQ